MSSSTSDARPKPPSVPRQEDRVVYAGVAPTDWNKDFPRQAEDSNEELIDPPVAVPDPYGWLRDDSRKEPQVLEHLKAENEYTKEMTNHLKEVTEELYQDFLSSIQETDFTVPRPKQDYYLYSRTFQGKAYSIHCRAPRSASLGTPNWDGSPDTPILPGEEILLDVNALAEGHTFCSVGRVRTSPSQTKLAYTVDFSGDEKCQLYVKDLKTNQLIHKADDLEIYGQVDWGMDDSTLYYLKLDAAQRPFQLYRRTILDYDKNTFQDELIFEEPNELVFLAFFKSDDGHFLFVDSSSTEASEYYYLDLREESPELKCIAKRRPKVLYEVEHRKGKWWISSNVEGTSNFRLFTAPAKPDCQDEWTLVTDPTTGKELFDGGYDRSLDGVAVFSGHVVAGGREGGIPRIWVLTCNDNQDQTVSKFERLEFPEAAHDAGLGMHYEFDTDKIAVAYDSLVTPLQMLEIDMNNPTGDRRVLKSKVVPGYKPELYACERYMVKARDGKTDIPVSLVYRKDAMEKHSANGERLPLHLYGYGSYGSCEEDYFSPTRLALLNRGVVFAVAHVRGGGEMGRQWYEEPNGGKYLCKKNTFNDFVDVARHLVDDRKLTSADKMSCEGRSAGGLLIGAVINQAPELFKVAVLGVPFVDVVCTMVDATIPLTCGEWEEWGNPNEKKFHQYMMEYSPMNNVKHLKYPTCLVTGGLNDPRVQYWEPAKFVATLRHEQDSESGPVCLKMEMDAGHASASDRYKNLREKAFDYSFVLDHLGLLEK